MESRIKGLDGLPGENKLVKKGDRYGKNNFSWRHNV